MKKEKLITPDHIIEMIGLEQHKRTFLRCVVLRLFLSLRLWFIHKNFRFNYPVKRTDPELWLIAYKDYLSKCQRLRDKISKL